MAYALRVGSSGIDVKKMQYYLNQILGAPNLKPLVEDGVYGQATEFAVAVFQYLHQLSVDGVLGSNTWNRIVTEFKNLSAPAPETNKTSRTLSVGSVGLGVQKFQEYLNQIIAPIPLLSTDAFILAPACTKSCSTRGEQFSAMALNSTGYLPLYFDRECRAE